MRARIRWFAVAAPALAAAWAAAPAAGASWSAAAQGALLRGEPEARVRESDVPGTFLDLDRTPGLDRTGFEGALRVERRLGRWRLAAFGSWTRQRGTGDAGDGFNFNGGAYPPGRRIRSTLTTVRLGLEAGYRVWGTPAGSRIRVLAGLEHYHPVLEMDADPPVPTHDRREDYLQFLPLPMLGGEYARPLGKRTRLRLRGWAGTGNRWNTHRSEGGPMTMSLTLAEAGAGVERPVGRSLDLALAYGFRYAAGTLESGQDGNWIRSREHGLRIALIWNAEP